MFYSLSGETPTRLDNVQLPFYTDGHPLNTYPQDMWPRDGWILAYRDFGSPSDAPPMPFFALYNKYRGILRVMFYNAPNVSYTYYKADLSFVSASASGALLTFTDPKRVSLDDYDAEKQESFMGMATQFRGWIHADLVVFGYDPTAHPDARFRVQIFGIDESSLSLESTVFTLTELATDSNPAASQSTLDDAIAAFNRGHKWYKSVSEGLTALEEAAETNEDHWWKPLVKSIVSLPIATYAPYIAGLLGFVSFFIGGSSKPAPREPLTFSGSLQMQGEVVLTRPIVAADLALFPGTSEPHYYRPVQPIPWGVFNLTRPLRMRSESHHHDITENCNITLDSWVLDDVPYVFQPDAGMQLKSIRVAFAYGDRGPSQLVDPADLRLQHYSQIGWPRETTELRSTPSSSPHEEFGTPRKCPDRESISPNGAWASHIAVELKLQVLEPVLHSDQEIVVYKLYPYQGVLV